MDMRTSWAHSEWSASAISPYRLGAAMPQSGKVESHLQIASVRVQPQATHKDKYIITLSGGSQPLLPVEHGIWAEAFLDGVGGEFEVGDDRFALFLNGEVSDGEWVIDVEWGFRELRFSLSMGMKVFASKHRILLSSLFDMVCVAVARGGMC